MESTVKHAELKKGMGVTFKCPSPDGVDCQALAYTYSDKAELFESVRLLMESTVKHDDTKVATTQKAAACPSPDGVDCQAQSNAGNEPHPLKCPSPDGVDCQARNWKQFVEDYRECPSPDGVDCQALEMSGE